MSTPSPPRIRNPMSDDSTLDGEDGISLSDDDNVASHSVSPGSRTKPAPPPSTPPPLSTSQLKRNRTAMTVLHFVLTYPRWSLSLFLIASSLTLPFTIPSMSEGFYQPFRDLRVLAQRESDLYAECVDDTLRHWRDKINATAQQEYRDSQRRRERNREVIRQVRLRAQTCANAGSDARRLLQTWQLHSPVPLRNDSTSACSPSDLDQVARLLRDRPDAALVQAQVATALDSYLAQSAEALQRLVDYAHERSAYDYNYFVGIKLQGARDLLRSVSINVSLPEWDSSLLLQTVTASSQGLLDVMQDMNVQLELQAGRLADFYTSIHGFYTQYQNLYSRLETAAAFVRDFLPAGIALPPSLDLSGIPLGATLLPPVWELPDFPSFPNLDGLASDALQRTVASMRGILSAWATSASDEVRRQLEDLQGSLQQLLNLDDYHPPQLVGLFGENRSLDSEIDKLREMALATKAQVLSSLNALGNSSSEASGVLNDWNSSSPGLKEETSSPLEFMKIDFPTFGLPSVWSFFFSWFWIFEPIIQLFRLIRLRKVYLQEATLELPEISFLVDGDQENNDARAAQERESTLAVLQLALLKQVLSPRTYLALLTVSLAIAGTAVWLPHVVHSCAGSRQGTLIARNVVAPLMINNASLLGSTKQVAAQYACHQNVEQVCSRLYAGSDWLYRQDVGELSAVAGQLRVSMDAMKTLDRCIDQAFLDAQQRLHCCGLEGYDGECQSGQVKEYCPINNQTSPKESFSVLGEYLTADECYNEEALHVSLQDSRFHCGVLAQVCDLVPCDGVDKVLLRSLSIEADCNSELHVVKCVLLCMLCVFHCFCLNFAATMAFRGAQRLLWKSLRPNGIQLRTHMNEQGDLVKGAKRVDRSARVMVAMRRFETVGRLQIAFSVILLLTWIAAVVILRRSLFNLKIQ